MPIEPIGLSSSQLKLQLFRIAPAEACWIEHMMETDDRFCKIVGADGWILLWDVMKLYYQALAAPFTFVVIVRL